MLCQLSTSIAPSSSSLWDYIATSVGVTWDWEGGFTAVIICTLSNNSRGAEAAAASTPDLTQFGREKCRKSSCLSDQGRIRPTPGEMYCLERSFLLHAGNFTISDSVGKFSCMPKMPKFCYKSLTVLNPLFPNMKQKKKKKNSNYIYDSVPK